MANIEYTPNLDLAKQPTGAKDWGAVLNENFEKIDREVLAKNKITNCITEIPQDIKLELNNGTLTLKAGSKVYVPNGSGKFDEVVTERDTVISGFNSATTTKYLVFLNSVVLAGYCFREADCFSGNSAPTATSSNTMWYDTANNIIQNSANQGESWKNVWGLPLAIVTASNKVATSIDQVFNGFGKIGGRMFALPGVKGLIPNGRNEDGSLKNIEFTISQVALSDREVLTGDNRAFFYNYLTNKLEDKTYAESNKIIAGVGQYIYNSVTNNIYSSGGQNSRWMLCGFYSAGDTGITSFSPKLPFKAADDQEVAKLASENVFTGNNSFIRPIKTYRVENTFADGSFADVTLTQDTNGTVFAQLRTRQEGQSASNWMGIHTSAGGVTSTRAPSPSIAATGTQIVTAEWVNQKIQEVSALPANPDVNIFYCIPE